MKTKNTFKIHYNFEGRGTVEIYAENSDEAVDKFYDGDWDNEDEHGYDYEVQEVEVIE